MKLAREKAKLALRKQFDSATDPQGYVDWPQDNLIPGVRLDQFEADLRREDGNELRMKFCAVHSSAALAVIQPSLEQVKLWPFDGDVPTLLERPGVTVAEIYPAETYPHLGICIGGGTRTTKTSRENRRQAAKHLPDNFTAGPVRLCDAPQSWIEWGFLSDDDFDAMVGVLCMLQIVTGQRSGAVPDTVEVKEIEGWILGQEFSDA